jgi:hypothetical protein
MANDPTCPAALRIATTHVGTGGNPKIGVPVGYLRPPPWTFPPLAPALTSFACVAVPNRPLSSPFSLVHRAKPTRLPYEDTSSSQALPALPSLKSEGQTANLVQDSAALLCSLAPPSTPLLPPCIPMSAIPSQVLPTGPPPFFSRFSRPSSFAVLASSSDDDDFPPSSDDEEFPLDVIPSPLSIEPFPFASLDTPIPASPVFRVTLDSLGRPVTTALRLVSSSQALHYPVRCAQPHPAHR